MPGRISSANDVSTPDPAPCSMSASRVGSVSVVPERRCGHRHGDLTVQVVAVAREGRVRGDVDLDVEVTGGSATGADLALVAELHPGAVVDARRDLDGQRAARPHPAVAGALAAGVGDDRAETTAGRAGTKGPDLAEERPLHVGDLALAAAGLARDRLGARRGAVAVAGRAQHRRVDLDLAGDTERGLGQLDLEPDQRVLAAAYSRARPAALAGSAGLTAEEGVHDVGEREAGALAEVGAAAERVAATVVRRPLLRVGQHLVGLRDDLEPLLGLRVRVDVRVQLPGEASVGLLDGVGVRIAGDTEQGVEVLAQRWVPSGRFGVGGPQASSRMRET